MRVRRTKRRRGRIDWESIARNCCVRRLVDTSSGSQAKRRRGSGRNTPWTRANNHSRRSPTGDLPRTGRTGSMRRGEIWFAATPGGDRPVLVLTRDPVAERIGSVVVAALTRTRRGLVSEVVLTPTEDGVPSDCVVNFDNVHTIPRLSFRRRVAVLSARRMARACDVLV